MPENLGESGAPTYNQIGHTRFEGNLTDNEEIIWAMDYNFDISEFVVEDIDDNSSHKKTHAYYGIDNPAQYCAKGRYEKTPDERGTCSVVYLFLNRPDVFEWSVKRKEYLGKNIIRALDSHYDNPDIYQVVDISQELEW